MELAPVVSPLAGACGIPGGLTESTKSCRLRWRTALAALIVLAPHSLQAVVPYTGGSYSQTFDGLHGSAIALADLPITGFPYHLADAPFTGSSGMGGWYVRNVASAALAYRVYADAGSGSGYINFGLAGSTNRALGGIAGSTNARPQFGVVLRNDTGGTINEIAVSFAGEQWRGTGSATTLVFDYQIGATPSVAAGGTFTEPGGNFNFTASGASGSINGKVEGRVNSLGGTLSGLTWAPGQYLVLRWSNSTSAAGMAIDDFQISTPGAPPPTPTPTPSPTPPPSPESAFMPFTGHHYSQNFDGLHASSLNGASLLPAASYPYYLDQPPFTEGIGLRGWFVRNGSSASPAYRVYGMAGESTGFVSFGRGSSGGGDRSLGGISNGGNTRPQFGIVLKNVTGVAISELDISFSGEQWRGTGASVTMKFGYGVQFTPDTSAATLVEPGGNFNFTASAPAGAIYGDTHGRSAGLGGSLQNLNWNPGEYLVLRWSIDDANAGLALDDLTITAPGLAPKAAVVQDDWVYVKFPHAFSVSQQRWFRLAGDSVPSGMTDNAFQPIKGDALNPATAPEERVSPAYASTGADPKTLLRWPTRAGAVSYNVHFGTSSSLGSGQFLGNRADRWISPGNLAPNTQYFWRVDAVDALGNVTAGNLWHFWTGDTPGTITMVDTMPNEPPNYFLRDWKQVARGFDSMVSDFNAEGQYLPIPFYTSAKRNFPQAFVNIGSFIGHFSLAGGMATQSTVIGASLSGVDKSKDPLTGLNYVTMQSSYHSVDKGLGVLYHSPTAGPVQSGWYQLFAAVSHWQLVDLYPEVAVNELMPANDGNTYTMEGILRSNADKWRDASQVINGNYSFFAFNFETMQPDYGGTLLPHLAGPVAWLEYTAYQRYGDTGYLAAADQALGFLQDLGFNPNHDLLLPYAGVAAARMNAEIGRNFNVGKFINWHFDNNGDVNESTGVAGGETWGGSSVAGLAGKPALPIEKVYPANTFHSAGVLAPVARYDQRYAQHIGKWLLNVAVNSRFFYPNFLPPTKQETASAAWAQQYDTNGYIAYEFLGKDSYFINKPLADHSTPNGSVLSGDHTSLMLADDGNYMVLKGANVPSGPRLRHIWQFNVPSGWTHKLRFEGRIVGSGAASGFRFAYSKNPAGPWTNIDLTFTDTTEVERTMNFAEVLKTNISPISGTLYLRVEDLGPLPSEGPDELHLDFLQIQTFDANTSPYLGGGHTAHGGTTDLCLYQSAQVGYLAGLVEPTNVEGVLQIDLCATDFLGAASWPTYLYYNPKPNSVSVQVNVGSEPVDIYDTITQQFLQQGVSGVRSFNIPANSTRVLVLTKSGGLRYYQGGKLFVDGAAVDYYNPAARAAEDTPANPAPLHASLHAALAASPMGDGMSNLLKYAVGLNPQAPASKTDREVVKLAKNSSGHNELRLRIPARRDDVRYTVQGSTDLKTWTTLAKAEGRNAFSAAEGLGHPLSIGSEGDRIVLGGFDDEDAPAAFYRLKVELR